MTEINKEIEEMARLMVGCKDRTCEDCLSQSKKLFGDNKCALIEYAEVLDKAGYRKESETVNEFVDKVLKDIGDAIDHNTRLMESLHNTNLATYHNALITNNACKGIYDMIQKIATEYGVEVEK